ncbi:MAG: threonylcarbamoyl-AMP synthase [Bacteroidales bacterium]|nr:threonylcarbamoyl-AMP synthase [Bacteroidales bacterium]
MNNHNDIEIAAGLIQKGKLVAFPTETVYGLGANAMDPLAVARIFELKERPSFDPLIVHIASVNDLKKLAGNVHENVLRLVDKFWPGPLTVVLPKSKLVPDIVTSGLPTVGIRMPKNDIALMLIKKSGCPVAAPSANKFGQLSPVCAEHVKKQLPQTDYILDGGKTEVGIESTIVSVNGNVCSILRPGYITAIDIENALPGTFIFDILPPKTNIAPGLLKSHYSPKKPLFITSETADVLPSSSGLILHSRRNHNCKADKVIYTSVNYNYTEIAANLFSALHDMEEDEKISRIFIEPVEETGLGIAIMDRLKKAAYQYRATK